MKRFIFLSAVFLFGCGHGPDSPYAFYYHGINFGAQPSAVARQGIADGCETALGYYRKDHWLFRNNVEYENGWFEGRKRCEPLRRAASP